MATAEKMRQREVHKYYHAWQDSFHGGSNDDSTPASRRINKSSAIITIRDKSLTAFAQLGCLRLNVKRCIVTLIDTTQQYILAEATRTLSLISDTGASNADDDMWFGNSFIPRHQGVSPDALAPAEYRAPDTDGASYSAPALVVNNLAEHPVYGQRAYAGKGGVSFYAGVPILTRTGYHIGVYSVTDDQPRDGISSSELRFLSEMAIIVMEHLESIRHEAARFRGETLVRGLGRFIQGASSLQMETGQEATGSEDQPPSVAANPAKSTARSFLGLTITAAHPQQVRPAVKSISSDSRIKLLSQGNTEPNAALPTVGSQPNHSDPSLRSTKTHDVDKEEKSSSTSVRRRASDQQSLMTADKPFSRAANILRECADADGVIFFDATAANLTYRAEKARYRPAEGHTNTKEPIDNNSYRGLGVANMPVTQGADQRRASSSDESDLSMSDGGSDHNLCHMLGYSIDISNQPGLDERYLSTFEITEKTLARLICQYPEGEVFHFGPENSVASSDGSATGDTSPPSTRPNLGNRTIRTSYQRKRMNRKVAKELLRIVPNARSVIWLPIWDFSKLRWMAGAFLWTRHSERLLDAQDDLNYLKTFANSITVEVARQDMASSDTAKSTFIANVSHELRTPLHGILGNIDILQDTKLDDFQTSLAAAIEVSGKTLTDTIDNILDYAKINHLSRGRRKGSDTRSKTLTGNPPPPVYDDSFDLAVLIEEVVEAVCASYAFYAKGKSKIDYGITMDAKRQSEFHESAARKLSNVQVILDIRRHNSWWVSTQPGGIRRVLTNVLGNALKYTHKGTITVCLKPSTEVNYPSSKLFFELVVADTGRGMSEDFVRNHAFTPFQQESQFSIGTGLGLSIVQQIVSSLNGQIKLTSAQGVGTKVKTLIGLPRVPKPVPTAPEDELRERVLQQTQGLSMCLVNLGGDAHELGGQSQQFAVFDRSLEAMGQAWFGLTTTWASSAQGVVADLFLYTTPPRPEVFIQHHQCEAGAPRAPIIAVTKNAVEQAVVSARSATAVEKHGLVFEVISHPLGPQKLAKAIQKCLQKSGRMPEDPKSKDQIAGFSREELDQVLSRDQSGDKDPRAPFLPQQPLSPIQTQGNIDNDTQIVSEHPMGRTVDPADLGDTHEGAKTAVTSLQSSDPAAVTRPDVTIPIRVLLVDDNQINLNILKQFMKRMKLPFSTAMDGLQAVQVYEEEFSRPNGGRITHVLMDISMPVLDGVQATREIRQFEQRQKCTPAHIFALSGVASEETQNAMFDAGADMFLPKPVKFKDLVRHIEDKP